MESSPPQATTTTRVASSWRRRGIVIVIAIGLLITLLGVVDPGGVVVSSSVSTAAAYGHAIPSLITGVTQTANDVSTDQVTISTEVDALSHVSIPVHRRSAATTSSCSEAVALFDAQHRVVLEANADYLRSFTPPDAPPDRWSGRAPVCGIHALYNATGELYCMQATDAARVGQQQSVTLRRCSNGRVSTAAIAQYLRGRGEPASACTDLYVSARLVGPSIVGARVHRVAENCDIVITYTVHDPGTYNLEVQVVWLNGLGPERSPPAHPLILRKIHSKFGKKPHQRYVFNEACEAQTHVAGSPFIVHAAPIPHTDHPLATDAVLPVCRFGREHQHGDGRWLRHRNDIPCNTSTPYCSGDPSLLNDAKPFNEDYVWAPHRCRLHYYSYHQGPKGPCASRSGTMLLMGDSTTREYAQSLKLFDLRNTQLRVEYANWKLDWQYFSRGMAEKSVARLGQELRGTRPVVLVANLGPLHLIGGLKSDDWQFYVDQWVKLFQPNGPLDFLEKKVFLGPAAIHYATNDMTAQRMLNWMAYAYDKLSPLGFEYVAAWNITEARPEASWDGVHYSAERGKAQMKKLQRRRKVFKWNGGVSVMLTNLLLNMLCTPNH